MIAGLLKSFFSKYLSYVYVGIAVAAIAATAYFTWNVRGAMAEADKAKAVARTVEEAQKRIDEERELRAKYQDRIDKQVSDMAVALRNLRGEFANINKSLVQDMEDNPDPYQAPVPAKGYESWMQARERARQSAQ